MASPVFVSYRRADSRHATGRLVSRLAPRYLAPAEIFMDTEAIPPGANFVDDLKREVNGAQVFLVMIGPDWLHRGPDGHRRIDDPLDFVHVEVSTALARKITVIPVLIDGAEMPSAGDLPPALKTLSERNAVHLRHEDFDKHADILAEKILAALGRSPDAELDLIRTLFAYKGKISRKQYWLGLLAVVLLQVPLLLGLDWALGLPLGTALDGGTGLPAKQQAIIQLANLWFWWPTTALVWKRIRDLGHGWELFGPTLAAVLAFNAANVAGLGDKALLLSVICLVIIVSLGALKGTRFVAHTV